MADTYRPDGYGRDDRRYGAPHDDYNRGFPPGVTRLPPRPYAQPPPFRRGSYHDLDRPSVRDRSRERSPNIYASQRGRSPQRYRDYDRYSPPPPRRQSSHERSDVYRFGKNGETSHDFAFSTNNAPNYPRFPPAGPRNEEEIAQRNKRHGRNPGKHGGDHRGGGQRGRPFRKPPTHKRALLTYERGTTPPLLQGMNGGEVSSMQKFRDFDDVSDSEEISMDESAEEDSSEYGTDAGDRPVKKIKAIEDLPAPKWSNPEVYTSLPPDMEQSNRKKKDLVKYIRKAKMDTSKDEQPAKNEAEDFISFNFSDDEKSTSHSPPPLNTPKQPRAFNGHPRISGSKDERQIAGLPTAISATNGQPLSDSDSNRVPPVTGTVGDRLAQLNAKMTGKVAPVDAVKDPQLSSRIDNLQDDLALVDLVNSRKRKRDEDDEPEDLVEPVHKKGRPDRPTGRVLPNWSKSRSNNPTPWLPDEDRSTDFPGNRLHKEILDFYHFAKPRHYEHRVRVDLLERLQNAVATYNPNVTVYSFGSFAAGLYLPNADMDVVLISQNFRNMGVRTIGQNHYEMTQIGKALIRHNIATGATIEYIPKARVPLLKYVDQLTGIKVDVSFENHTGIIANDTYAEWKSRFPALPALAAVIKQFLLMRGLSEVPSGGIGGFSTVCLIVNLLQTIPRVYNGGTQCGELLLDFLDFYGNRLDYTKAAIRMSPPGLVDKRYVRTYKIPKLDRLCILDPNDSANDLSGGTSGIDLIFAAFRAFRMKLLSTLQMENCKSILEEVLGGNYNDFLWQRRQLRKVHEAKFGRT